MNKTRQWMIAILLAATSLAAAQEAAWWEPAAPVVGQTFIVFYDDIVGVLPNNSPQCWLHWGVVDTATGNWSAPPQSSWPPGSQLAPGGSACQSPMQRGTGNYWNVSIAPDSSILNIEFVFTDMAGQWDNNNNQNWAINFVGADVPSWWYPADPLPGDLLTIYYNTVPGALPNNSQNVKLHWGINEQGAGNWQEPPVSMWPPGSVPWGDNQAVQTPMINSEAGIWYLEIQSNDTTYSLHYVVTNGTVWDNNSNANWNITLQEPPPLVNTYHRFIYDTRSAFATYGLGTISTIRVAGTFNNWSSTANPLSGPDSRGVYSTEISLPATSTGYKFVINGNVWLQDPDNPMTDGSSYLNSFIALAPDSTPYFTQVSPAQGTIYITGQTAAISAVVRSADFGLGLPATAPTLLHNGAPVSVNYNSSTGLVSADILLTAAELHLFNFSIADSAGRTGFFTLYLGAYPASSGFHAIDPEGDDVGGGAYSYPSGSTAAADLTYFEMTEAASGDSIRFQIELVDLTSASRVLMQIGTDIGGFYFDPPLFSTETASPDWNGSGVQLCLADPSSPAFDPAIHNRLIVQRDPVLTGAAISLSPAGLAVNRFDFEISAAELEAILGSYNRGWYFGAWAFLDGFAGSSGHSWEVDALHGGSEAIYDPDLFDTIFMDDADLQKTLLSNYSPNRRSTLDNSGRGFALVEPDQIGPNVGSPGPVLTLLTRGAPTIIPQQTITGLNLSGQAATISVHQQVGINSYTYDIPAVTDTFETQITLEEGANTIWAEATIGNETGISPAIIFNLSVNHSPDPEITVTYSNGTVTLDASASTDPDGQMITFLWAADSQNPAPISLNNPNNAICTFDAPQVAGEYYVDLRLEDPDANVTNARTLATVYPDSVHPFDWNESVQWVQDAVIYEIFPRSYSANHQLSSITADLARIYDLGCTAIWLMPIYPGPTDHGYEITDYYGIEQDYGTPEDFADLVLAAHSYGIKIILDLVINHTSIQHPFMQDAIAYGPFSHYYNYYDRDAGGNYTYYYDWISLPNLNYDNEEVWDYFIEVSKWWVQQYDVDGYRCDVAWGPQTRNAAFWPLWRETLKEMKPELLLLAEATSTDFTYYDHRFDAAYDWNLHHEAPTNLQNMLPGPPNLNQLHDAITNYGYPYPTFHYPFRFLENHDEERYVVSHTPDETKLAATLLMTLPGIPLVYAGQEIGTASQRGQIYWGIDPNNYFPHYYRLVHARNLFPALRAAAITRLNNTQYSTVYSYGRHQPGQNPVISVLNFASWSQVISLTVPIADWGIQPDSTYCVNDLLNQSYVWMTGTQIANLTTSLDAKKGRVYAIADSIIIVPVELVKNSETPKSFALEQNFPNPFNQECRILFSVPNPGKVAISIYNLLGQRVRKLEDRTLNAGQYALTWDGRSDEGLTLSSGMYFCRMQAGDFQKTRKLILLR